MYVAHPCTECGADLNQLQDTSGPFWLRGNLGSSSAAWPPDWSVAFYELTEAYISRQNLNVKVLDFVQLGGLKKTAIISSKQAEMR